MLRIQPRTRVVFASFLGLAALSVASSIGCDRASDGAPAAPSAQPAAAATPDASGTASLAAAEELMKKRDIEGALAMLNVLVEAPNPEPKVFQRLAEVHAARSEFSKGVLVLRRGLAMHPKSGQLSYNLARLYQVLEQFDQACAELDKARANGASERDVAMLYGTCLGQQSKFDKSSAEFEKALAAGADPTTVRYNQALICSQKKEFVKAQQILEPLVAADPTFHDAKRELAHAIMLGGADAASANLGLGMLMDLKEPLGAKDFHLWEYMGDGWMLLGDFEAAIQSYTEALRLGKNPKAVEDKYRTAALERKKQQKAKAEAEAPPSDGKSAKAPVERSLPDSNPH